MEQTISRLLAHERIRAARHHLERTEEITLARQAALSAVPAPTGAEGRRAARVAELFREVGLQDVLIDEVGNVRGWTAGAGGSGKRDGAGPVVLAAHLDTVFGPDVNVAVERRGRRLRGPGISDNARGLAALVAVAEAVVAARVPAARPILFAATVGEEGSGDLRGVKYLLNGKDVGAPHAVPLQQPPIAFIALDGAGLERVVHRALGSKRYHVTYRDPGERGGPRRGAARRPAALLPSSSAHDVRRRAPGRRHRTQLYPAGRLARPRPAERGSQGTGRARRHGARSARAGARRREPPSCGRHRPAHARAAARG